MLSSDGELSSVDSEESSIHAAVALKDKRLTFTWLNGESQEVSLSLFVYSHFVFMFSHLEYGQLTIDMFDARIMPIWEFLKFCMQKFLVVLIF